MVNPLERNGPSSFVLFPLYKSISLPLILYFPQRIQDQGAAVFFDKLAYRLLGAPVIYTSPVAHLQPISIFTFLLNSLAIF